MDKGNWFKQLLQKTNHRFREQQKGQEFKVDPLNHVVDRKYGTVKNFMRLTNKTMIGFQNTRVNKMAIFMSLLGLSLGHLCAEIDDAITFFKRNYRKVVKQVIVSQVLKNNQLKDKLNSTLLKNVYTNPDIQYNLHQVLENKAIKDHKDDLFLLSKKRIIEALENRTIRNQLSKMAAKALLDNENTIGRLALEFLGGLIMDRILKNQLTKLLGD